MMCMPMHARTSCVGQSSEDTPDPASIEYALLMWASDEVVMRKKSRVALAANLPALQVVSLQSFSAVTARPYKTHT